MIESNGSESNASKNQAVSGLVTGRVQGVGFRCFTQDNAQRLGLSGFVRNMPDSSVEFLIQGSPHKVEAMLVCLDKGPEYSRVESCERNYASFDDAIIGFEIRY